MRNRRETKEKYMKKIMLALILCLVATPALAAEKEVVIRDKKGTTYLVTYNCRVRAERAWASVVAVGEAIKIRGRDGRGRICTITKVQAFA
tara:strand:+ start:2159 stop:2431 length:273 start_codon:yes stop_codon:yes gene_type:complete